MSKKQTNDTNEGEGLLIDAIDKINKKYGKGSCYKYGDADPVSVAVVPTPSLRLNADLGVGGIPRGRVTEIFGHPGSAKTSLTLQIIAIAQESGLKCAFIDVEQALDPAFATLLGVDMDELYFSQPDSGEEAMDIVATLINTRQFALIIVDSVAALVSQAELNGEIGDSHVALQARLMSQSLRKITGNLRQTNTGVVFINQVRDKINISGYGGGGVDTPGGKALKFYASLRLETRKIEDIRRGDDVIGQKVQVKVAKNKLAAPFKKLTLPFYFDRGFDSENDLLDMAIDFGILSRKGAWYYIGNDQLAQGKENSFAAIKANPKLYQEVERGVLMEINPDLAKKKGYDIEKPKDTPNQEVDEGKSVDA